MFSLGTTATQLQNHVDSFSRLDIIILQTLVISELLATEDESNLVNCNSFFFLQLLLHCAHFILWFERIVLFAPRQRLNEDLHSATTFQKRSNLFTKVMRALNPSSMNYQKFAGDHWKTKTTPFPLNVSIKAHHWF